MSKNRIKKEWVTFSFTTDFPCKIVAVKGEWDQWNEHTMRLKKDGSFYLRKKIECGQWEYGFLVDGEVWCCDETVPVVQSPFGTLNSILKIGGES